MTPEEADKKIEFILQMQAQFEGNIGKLEANLVRCETNIDKLRESQATLTASVVNVAEILRESVRISDERFTRLDDRLIVLADAQKGTYDRLNALIHVVERHITGPDHSPQSQ